MSSTEPTPGLVVQNLPAKLRLSDYKLIAFDMDSTLINIECIDEIADAVSRKAEVAAITEAAMRGEITDFKDSLRRRLALLQGVTVADLEGVKTQRLRLNPGAAALVAACQKPGLKVLLVSGGFTYFAEHVCALLAIDFMRSNALEIEGGALTGWLDPAKLGRNLRRRRETPHAARGSVPDEHPPRAVHCHGPMVPTTCQ